MRTNLKVLRVRHGKTQTEFAKLLGVSRSYYCFVENGTKPPSMKLWDAIRERLAVPDSEIRELLKNDEEE